MLDAFNPNPLSTEEELDKFYYETAEARTGDSYSDFVKQMMMQLEDSRESNLHKLFIGHAGSGKTTGLNLHPLVERGLVQNKKITGKE